MSYWIVNGQKLTNEEYAEYKNQEELKKQRVEEETAQLTRNLGYAYEALRLHLHEHADKDRKITDERVLDHEIYRKLRNNLERANHAPRCSAIKEDGTRCAAPKLKSGIYCYAHTKMAEARACNVTLPALEDGNGIQMALMLVQKALIDDEISEKKAGLLLYSIQIAAANVDRTTFGQAADEDMVTDCVPETTAIANHAQIEEKRKAVEEVKQNGSFSPAAAEETLKMLPQPADTSRLEAGLGLG